jgi:hypothetical protein
MDMQTPSSAISVVKREFEMLESSNALVKKVAPLRGIPQKRGDAYLGR